MEIDILTKRDLEEFRNRLLNDLRQLLDNPREESHKQYLRSREVRKMLGGISNGTLQNLRVKRLLNPSKIEGVFYYKTEEVKALLNGNVRT